MNYIEWIMERSAALWRGYEAQMKERLLRAAAGKTADGTERTDRTVQEAGRKDAEEDRAETDAARRLARKLGGEMQGETYETRGAPDNPMTRAAAPGTGEKTAAAGEGAAAWLKQELARGDAPGLTAPAREPDSFLATQEAGAAETRRQSNELERDARRYDGGFLFY